jgi:hypothetical protein
MAGQDYLFEPAHEPLLARIEELGYRTDPRDDVAVRWVKENGDRS